MFPILDTSLWRRVLSQYGLQYETPVFETDFSCIFPGICGDSNGMILASNGREHLVLWTFIGELKLENTKAFNCIVRKKVETHEFTYS